MWDERPRRTRKQDTCRAQQRDRHTKALRHNGAYGEGAHTRDFGDKVTSAVKQRSTARTRVYILCIRGYCGIAYGLLVAGRIQIRAGVGTTGGALAALSSRPWLMARVIEYSRIAMAAARAAAAAHACMVWLMCVVRADRSTFAEATAAVYFTRVLVGTNTSAQRTAAAWVCIYVQHARHRSAMGHLASLC